MDCAEIYSAYWTNDEEPFISINRGTHGVMVSVLGNGHGDSSSNQRQGCLHIM